MTYVDVFVAAVPTENKTSIKPMRKKLRPYSRNTVH